MKTALLASYAKDEPLLRLATALTEAGWSLMGSAGTAKYLKESGLVCIDVADIVGPPILGHRVVTLAREIYAGLLATEADRAELETSRMRWIDLVYVTLYPLEATIADPASTPDDVLEKTDIGGPTLLRAAAKGRRLTLSDPSHIDLLEAWLNAGSPESEHESLVTKLAAAAERRVASYVAASADYWESRVK
ncbi:MAG: phosphoribosylaminoimidazolecarboxamide formyltransferase / IMP cyclohydrolase [Parcubacteria group bacterium Athens0416_74]|nr:MAG: phosphoribosylaminoimidazolecarboxamide formyltransferase / IMP cyclohydrolase [Parcubacteria group bacterium Athens0416_74]